jgi:F0F1-type ATP synthase epsilon subunit
MTAKSAIDDHKVLAKPEPHAHASHAGKGKQTMRVHVHSPFRDYYDGEAYSLTAINATGEFDILPHHHSFISLLLPCELVIRTPLEEEIKIRISGGILHVKADQVVVFLDV